MIYIFLKMLRNIQKWRANMLYAFVNIVMYKGNIKIIFNMGGVT